MSTPKIDYESIAFGIACVIISVISKALYDNLKLYAKDQRYLIPGVTQSTN